MNMIILLFVIGLGVRLHRFLRQRTASRRPSTRDSDALDVQRVRRTLHLERTTVPRGGVSNARRGGSGFPGRAAEFEDLG